MIDKNLICTDMSLLGVVLFGGYVVDDAWLQKSRPLFAEGKVLEPLWRIEGAVLRKSVEWCLDHKSCGRNGLPEEVLALAQAKPEILLQQEVRDVSGTTVLQNELRSLWVWRENRCDLRRKESWLICGSDKDVDEFEAKKKKQEAAIEELEKEIADMQSEITKAKQPVARKKMEVMLNKKKVNLKEEQGKMKQRKGIPITLRKFFEEQVLPHALLCPHIPSKKKKADE